jgi:TPR repeat protein
MANSPPSLKVFIVYARKDSRLLQDLRAHLSLLRRQQLIADWHDRDIDAGDDWRTEISEHLEAADVVLLLISAHFLASDYCFEIEMKRAVERHEQGSVVIVPVALRPCDWTSLPIADFQGLPTDLRPVTSWPDRHAAWADVARGLRAIAEKRQALRSGTEPMPDATPLTERSAGTSDPLADVQSLYRKAAAAGDAKAAYNLAVILHERGDLDSAEPFYRQAVEGDRADAVNNLGLLLIERGNLDAGKRMLREAIEHGSSDAPANLGSRLMELGELEEAEQVLMRFASIGNALAAANLAVFYDRHGKPDDARHWYIVASDAGIPHAMSNFGVFLNEQGEIAAAERILRDASTKDNIEAAYNLGVILAKQDRRDEAADAYRAAAEHGHLAAANNLGAILRDDGDLTEAERWFRRAAGGGHTLGATNLAILLEHEAKRDGEPGKASKERLD